MIPSQAKLNIVERSRTSLLPWRGQFSPDLVEHLVDTFCPAASVIADPFCGSGTVVAEAMRRGVTGIGVDINPAAYILSSFSRLLALGAGERATLAAEAAALVARRALRTEAASEAADPSIAEIVEGVQSPQLRLLLHIAALVGCGDSTDLSSWKLAKGVQSVLRTLREVEPLGGCAEVVLGDARHELQSRPCDAIITSPPYINVFNYHQNYRPVMEHLGWAPLSCAVAEIGANRKHRQNRYLTVVQYCIDMALTFSAAIRSLDRAGVFVVVLGRESNVLRTPFYNGGLIERVVDELGFFAIAGRHERVFTNRFGASIYEDILVLKPSGSAIASEAEVTATARRVGIDALRRAWDRAPPSSISLIEGAVVAGEAVRASTRPALEVPALWPLF